MYETIATVFEIIFLICFGASWPFNIIRAYKARTAKGTSIQFMFFIALGYVAGICKMVFTYLDDGAAEAIKIVAFVFYIVNLSMVIAGIAIFFRNKKLDCEAARTGRE